MQTLAQGAACQAGDEVKNLESSGLTESPGANRKGSAESLEYEVPDRINVPEEIQKLERRIGSSSESSTQESADKVVSSIAETKPSEIPEKSQSISQDGCVSSSSSTSEKLVSDTLPEKSVKESMVEKSSSGTEAIKPVRKDSCGSSEVSAILVEKSSAVVPKDEAVPQNVSGPLDISKPPVTDPLKSRKTTDSCITSKGEPKKPDESLKKSSVVPKSGSGPLDTSKEAVIDPLSVKTSLAAAPKNKAGPKSVSGPLGISKAPVMDPLKSRRLTDSSITSDGEPKKLDLSAKASSGAVPKDNAALKRVSGPSDTSEPPVIDPLKSSKTIEDRRASEGEPKKPDVSVKASSVALPSEKADQENVTKPSDDPEPPVADPMNPHKTTASSIDSAKLDSSVNSSPVGLPADSAVSKKIPEGVERPLVGPLNPRKTTAGSMESAKPDLSANSSPVGLPIDSTAAKKTPGGPEPPLVDPPKTRKMTDCSIASEGETKKPDLSLKTSSIAMPAEKAAPQNVNEPSDKSESPVVDPLKPRKTIDGSIASERESKKPSVKTSSIALPAETAASKNGAKALEKSEPPVDDPLKPHTTTASSIDSAKSDLPANTSPVGLRTDSAVSKKTPEGVGPPLVDPLKSGKKTDSSIRSEVESKKLDRAAADPLRCASSKAPVKQDVKAVPSQSAVVADPLSALLDQKKNKAAPVDASGVLGFTPPSRWLSSQAGVSAIAAPQETEAKTLGLNTNAAPPLGTQLKPSPPKDVVGDPLAALRDQKRVEQIDQRKRSSLDSELFDVDGVLGRSFGSQSEVRSAGSEPRSEAKDTNVRIPTEADLATSLQDFLGDLGSAFDMGEEVTPQHRRMDEADGDMARAVCKSLPANEYDGRWSEQTIEVHEEETLTIGPFPGQKYEILRALFGVIDRSSVIDVTHVVQQLRQKCNSESLKITKADLGAEVNSPEALRGVVGWRVISVTYRVKVRESDVSHGNFREGVGRVGNVVPILTKTLANVVGATLAAGGYAVAKAEMGVRNRLLATRDENGQRVGGTDSGLADSEIFQAGFNAWLRLNGIKPTIVYEPAGKAATRLKWIYAESGGRADMLPEDIKQTPLLIANHISYIDALVLTTIFGAPKVIAKSGTLNTPLIGRFAKEIGVIEVDRGSKSSRQATLDAISDHVASWRPGDRPLLLFPEGTTSNGVDLLEFKKGAFAPGAPVRPIVICYTGKWHPANTNFKMSGGEIKPTNDLEWTEQFLGHFIHSLNVKVLPPYIPRDEEKSDPSLFAGNVRCVVAETYAQMRMQAEAQAGERERTRASGPLQRVREVMTGHRD